MPEMIGTLRMTSGAKYCSINGVIKKRSILHSYQNEEHIVDIQNKKKKQKTRDKERFKNKKINVVPEKQCFRV